ncbi:protocatechuate 3,4-dioxygenase subunit beta [Nitriliruptor alkaliphilus]|uniref:protocatechuate 3,4-dioxygenase subunit beta n=1 Tax=Nitriliruptor alkaliphilus TaxID=427918 RepID=UPI000698C83E|nr:protocatechuate 3,4-dioxygenase subunit beta [Nitriliruptor alkaliphilus]
MSATPEAYRRRDEAAFPPYDHPSYRSTNLRHPKEPLVRLEHTLSEITGPGPALAEVTEEDADLTRNAGTGQEAMGERIIVTGRVSDENGDPAPRTLVEIWQCNAAGRYIHEKDQHPAPLDPNFIGAGKAITDEDGSYRFLTIKPGAYPWRNHPNAWRPAHIHFSLFGPAFVTRLVTQMYFPGDPLHDLDPIMGGVPREAWPRMIASYDHTITEEEWALGYRFDIVLRGPEATPFEPTGAGALATPGQEQA